MNDDVSDIAAYYNNVWEREESRLERHQLERDLTWRYLLEYLPKQASILEIGAATGRYTAALAKLGNHVTAVDLSPVLLEQCRARISAEGLVDRVQLMVADARDLSQVTRDDYDAVLLMGPLYHLVDEMDRKAALKQAFERLRQKPLAVVDRQANRKS